MSRFALGLFLLAALPLPAAITFTGSTGFADKAKLDNTATFTVIADPNAATTTATLDGVPVPVGSAVTVTSIQYHELKAESRAAGGALVDSKTIRFIVRDFAVRGNTEDGIPPHTPYRTVNDAPSAFAGGTLKIIAPAAWPAGLPVPIAASLRRSDGESLWLNGVVHLTGFPTSTIQLRRGWGSAVAAAVNTPGAHPVGASVNGLTSNRSISIEATPTFTDMSGTISADTTWPANSRVRVTGTLTIAAGTTLTIGAGSIILVDTGNGTGSSAAELVVNGTLQANGTEAAPIVFAPATAGGYWGGIELPAATSTLNATFTIFSGSGEDQTWFTSHSGYSSHKPQQALFLLSGSGAGNSVGAQLHLTDCYCFSLAGQMMNGKIRTWIDLKRTLMQRAVTCGELNGDKVTIDRSALLEFPSEDATFVDGDNDAIYLTSGDLSLTNNVIGFTKDDGVDSGGDGGDNPFTAAADVTPYISANNWYEGTYHEGNSLSGTRNVTFTDCVFFNCGQGVEDGYSASATGDGPNAVVDGCLFSSNMVGVRWGDNYGSGYTYNGAMEVKNSFLLNSLFHDAWSYDWNDWTYYTTQTNSFGRARFNVHDNWISQPDVAHHPINTTWNPATQGALIAPFMPVPGSNVGVAVTSYDPQQLTTAYSGQFVVRLSTFSSKTVTVDYAIRGRISPTADEVGLGSGTLTFAPGETLKTVSSPVASAVNFQFMHVALSNAVNAEPTGDYLYVTPPVIPQPQTLLSTASTGWRYRETRSEPPANWRDLTFDDSGAEWLPAALPAGFGVAGVTYGTTVGFGGNTSDKTRAYYFRHKFTVADPAAFASLKFRVRRDDGVAVWLNGESTPSVISADGTWTAPFPYASNPPPNSTNTANYLEYTIPAAKLVAGQNILAIQVGQTSLTSSDLLLDCELIGTPPIPLELSFGHSAGHPLLWWYDSTATLEHSTDLLNWSPLPPDASPLIITPAQAKEFWRLRK